jgi:hypothetical protein
MIYVWYKKYKHDKVIFKKTYVLHNYMVTGDECQNHHHVLQLVQSISLTHYDELQWFCFPLWMLYLTTAYPSHIHFLYRNNFFTVTILHNDRSLSSLKFNYTLNHTTTNCANNLTFTSPLVSLLPWNGNLLTVSATITQTLYNTI